MTVGVSIHWTFTVDTTASDTGLLAHGDRLTEELLAQEDCTPQMLDSAVSVDRGAGTVEIEVSVKAESLNEAVAVGQAAIRAAIHASGGSTPNWPSHEDMLMVPMTLETEPLSLA